MKAASIAALAIASTASLAQAAPILFNVDRTSPPDFHNTGAGADLSATDGTTTVTLTTVDVQAPEYAATSPFAPTGNTLSNAGGPGLTTSATTVTFAASGSPTQLGVNNGSISDANFVTLGGTSGESGNFDRGEAWIFRFDQPVTISILNLSSVDAGDEATLSYGTTSVTLVDGQTNDDYADPFGGALIPANTPITFRNTAAGIASTVRIDSITINPIPEPATLAVAGLGTLLLGRRRR